MFICVKILIIVRNNNNINHTILIGWRIPAATIAGRWIISRWWAPWFALAGGCLWATTRRGPRWRWRFRARLDCIIFYFPATTLNSPCMITSLNFIIPYSSLAASEIVSDPSTVAVVNTTIEFIAIVWISVKTFTGATRACRISRFAIKSNGAGNHIVLTLIILP